MGQIYYQENRPESNTPEGLFNFCVRMAIKKNLFSLAKTHSQWANLLFSYESNSLIREDNMSIVKRERSIYFTRDRNKFSFIEDKIKRDFPSLFGITDEDNDLLSETINAVSHEIEEQKNPNNIDSFKGNDLTLVQKQGNSYLYYVFLTMSDEKEPDFHEDTPFILRYYDEDILCEYVDYDFESGRLSFTSNRFLKSKRFCRILLDSTFILEGLRKRLVDLDENWDSDDLPFTKLLLDKAKNLTEVKHKYVPDRFKAKLDESQREAFDAALDHDITFIWGPPEQENHLP